MNENAKLQKLLGIASELKIQNNKEQALEAYSGAFDTLIDEASVYAKSKEGDLKDIHQMRLIEDTLLEDSKEYLRRDETASSILNEMAVLFRDMGDYSNAKQKFEEAIDLIPANSDFTDPQTNLANLPIPVSGELIINIDEQ